MLSLMLAMKCVLSERLHFDDLVFTREIVDGFQNKFRKWMKVVES